MCLRLEFFVNHETFAQISEQVDRQPGRQLMVLVAIPRRTASPQVLPTAKSVLGLGVMVMLIGLTYLATLTVIKEVGITNRGSVCCVIKSRGHIVSGRIKCGRRGSAAMVGAAMYVSRLERVYTVFTGARRKSVDSVRWNYFSSQPWSPPMSLSSAYHFDKRFFFEATVETKSTLASPQRRARARHVA